MNTYSQRPQGIISVLQTPFNTENQIDFKSYSRLIQHAINSGVDGFLVPVVASEVAYLNSNERTALVRHVHSFTENKIQLIIGASANTPEQCAPFIKLAEAVEAAAFLVAMPSNFYQKTENIIPYFQAISKLSSLPMIIQDFELNGPGLSLELIRELKRLLPNLAGLKVETQPAGPKYTAIRNICGKDFFIAGGWAVTQMIEALDRGVNAMIPESAMIPVYKAIFNIYKQGNRELAQNYFRRMLPVLSFTNQEVATSIAFFKKLLVQKRIFTHPGMRWPGFEWDEFNSRIATELIKHYLELETEILN